MSQNKLISGKNDTQNIVSVESIDGLLHIFKEDGKGNVTEDFIPNKYWILSTTPQKGFVRLKGDLPYKWGKQYSKKEEWSKARYYYKNSGTDVFSMYNGKEASLINKGITYFKGLKHTEVSILSTDIETTGLAFDSTAKLILITNTFRKNGVITRKLFCYDEYEDEGQMIVAWCDWVREINPSIICGHNIESYDFKYIKFIADKFNVPVALGRDGSNLYFDRHESKFRKDSTMFYHYHRPHIYGREIIDTMFVSIKADIGRKYESYGLKSIIKAEGLEIKDRVFYDASKIRFNYKNPIEMKKIKDYAIVDADDSLALYDLLIPSFFYLTSYVPKSFQSIIETATGSQVNAMMIRSYLQDSHSLPKADEIESSFEGAISLGNPGIYKNAIKWDVASLYPSIMLAYDIYPKHKDPMKNLITIVQILREERFNNKELAKKTGDRYYKDLDGSGKILINSIYGTLGTPGLMFNYKEGASEVTSKGREILKTAIKWATGEDLVL